MKANKHSLSLIQVRKTRHLGGFEYFCFEPRALEGIVWLIFLSRNHLLPYFEINWTAFIL